MTTPSTSAQWKLVPVEPTDEMVAAWPRFNKGAGHERAIYAAMVAAAPASPSPAASPASPSGVLEDAVFLAALLRIDTQRAGVPEVVREHLEKAASLLSSLASDATPAPTTENGQEWRWRQRHPAGDWSAWQDHPMGKIDVSFYEVQTRTKPATPAPTSGSEDGGDWRPVLTEMVAAMNRYGHDIGDGDIPSAHRSLVWRAEQLLAKPASEPAGGDVVRRLHCDHCSARFNTEWERVEHERERHAAPYAWVVMGSSALCGEHVITTSEEVRDRWAANPSVQIVALYTTPPAALSSSAGPAVAPDMRRICEALGFDPGNHHNALKCPYCNPKGLRFAHPAPATVEMLTEAAKAGWNACRKSIYAVCEDVISENERHREDTENPPRHHFGRGGMTAAKSIARGFNSMEAEDDDNFTAARAALAPATEGRKG